MLSAVKTPISSKLVDTGMRSRVSTSRISGAVACTYVYAAGSALKPFFESRS